MCGIEREAGGTEPGICGIEHEAGGSGPGICGADTCRVGIDVGSTYTKYCILSEEELHLYTERTPVRQREHFADRLLELETRYPGASVVSCGYGRKNVAGMDRVSELTALAKGSFYAAPDLETVLDIGGQDTKVICQQEGRLKKFFMNDRCAAGSGMFLANTVRLLEIPFEKIDLTSAGKPEVHLSSVCAVFAQSEITELLAENTPAEEILRAVIWQILAQAGALLGKVEKSPVMLSGGLTEIRGMREYAQLALERECVVPEHGKYLSAIGCALMR